MKKGAKGIVNPLSKKYLKNLIKQHGFQSWKFDEKLLFFQWDGLEYEFYIYEDSIYLEKIIVRDDIILANLENYKLNIQNAKPKLPDFLEYE